MKRVQRYLATGAVAVMVFSAAVCYGETLNVVSSNNGTGRFSWTFTKGDEANVWEVMTVQIESYGIEDIFSPPGWTASNDTGFVVWEYTNGTLYVEDTPIEFAVQSAFTNSTLYTNSAGEFFPEGSLQGYLCNSNHTRLVPGFAGYTVTGPHPMPHFSSFGISNSQLHFAVEEMLGSTCYVERSYNLLSNDWQTATNFTVETINTNLTQPFVTNQAFYRLRLTH